MGVRVPRITVNVDFGDDAAFGDLSLLSVGYGLHQAWVYATMFGTASVFGTANYVTGLYGSSVSLPYMVSIIVYVAFLLFAGATDQRFLSTYVSKKTLVAGAVLTSAGTLLLLAPTFPGSTAVEIVSGCMTGIGSGVLILFWGTAFARCDSASIVINSAFAISIAIGVFALALHYAPFPIAGLLTAVVPLLELAILWKKTPRPFQERDQMPVFEPLPINHGKFVARFGTPVIAFGLALGMLRQNSLQSVVAEPGIGGQVTPLLAAGCATIILLVTIIALGGSDKWSRYFQPLVPLIAVTVFFVPFSNSEYSIISSMFLIVGFLCFESLMWIFFSELSQRFRLSPVFVFGIGRGLLALAIMAGSLVPIAAANWAHALPFGEQSIILLMLLVMVIAYAMLPREREIEAIVAPCPAVRAVTSSLEEAAGPRARFVHSLGTVGIDEEDEEPQAAGVASGEPAGAGGDAGTAGAGAAGGDAGAAGAGAAGSAAAGTEPPQGGGRFRGKCQTVANTYLLSRRESEIMFFLAKGHNAAYIQEKLYISEGTAKTHIRHIYRKMDIHSQQELMRLVESAEAE